MCGIVGYIGGREAAPILMDGLRRLEYRGYDSAGLAVLAPDGRLAVRKREGKLARLDALLAAEPGPPAGTLGLGHTRWATHGPPTLANAHPHHDEARRVAVVHNGIIENHAALRAELEARGHRFSSQTDTEVVAHLFEEILDALPEAERDSAVAGAPSEPEDPQTRRLLAALGTLVGRLEGAYALGLALAERPDTLIAARRFSPLVIGLGEGESHLASDIPALLPQTRRVLWLEDGETALLRRDGVRIYDAEGRPVERDPIEVTWQAEAAQKGGYAHFVRKEIDEQPRALADTLRGRIDGEAVHLPELEALDPAALHRVVFVAAGSSYYAGLLGRAWMERWARLPAEVAVASELRYGDPVLGPDTLVVLVSQSGETADTLAAGRRAAAAGAPTLAITNVVGSSLARAAGATLYLQVGPEIGVVATKTFTGQLGLLALLALALGRRRGALAGAREAAILRDMADLPARMTQVLDREAAVAAVARRLAERRSMFFIGRGFGYPVALEAALKLKEISYLHAEGYPAGELKHGPIAMLDPTIPVFAIATDSPTRAKLRANIEEVRARGAEVLALATDGDARIGDLAEHVLWVPPMRETLAPFVEVIPAQLFAYHLALALGRDVDQPRNLAKSVTVE